MCEFSRKLIALLDGELPADGAADVGRHLRVCAECRSELVVFEKLSSAVESYCEGVAAACEPRRRRHYGRQAVLCVGAATIAAVIALVATLSHPRKMHPDGGPVSAPAKVRTNMVEEAVNSADGPATHVKTIHRRVTAPPARAEETPQQAAEPVIQITIPADAVLPPGAVPAGVSYVADVRIPANGSAQPWLVWP